MRQPLCVLFAAVGALPVLGARAGEPVYWPQLSERERRVVSEKLVPRSEGQSPAERFEELIVKSDASGRPDLAASLESFKTVRNFLVAAGGYEDGPLWREIASIDWTWPTGLSFLTASDDAREFRAVLKSERFLVNHRFDRWFGKHVISARARTESASDPSMHITHEKGFEGAKWMVHWDPVSPNPDGWPVFRPFKQLWAAFFRSHHHNATADRVRSYLERSGRPVDAGVVDVKSPSGMLTMPVHGSADHRGEERQQVLPVDSQGGRAQGSDRPPSQAPVPDA